MNKLADEWLKPVGAIVVTLFTGIILVWWLVLVRDKIGATPQLDSEGNVILDEWQRAKDILLVVVPLFTAAMGYWIGSKESATAAEKADKAEKKATEAEQKVEALSGNLDPQAFQALREKYPNLF
jgi:hypothetical protein